MIVISYAREDYAVAGRLAATLEADGQEVWWDDRLAAGDDFAAEVGRRLEAASHVIVVWSQASILSGWVRDEADTAMRLGKLVPVLFGVDTPPIGFRSLHAIPIEETNRLLTAVDGLQRAEDGTPVMSLSWQALVGNLLLSVVLWGLLAVPAVFIWRMISGGN